MHDTDGFKLQIEDEAGNRVDELYCLPDDTSTENDLAAERADKVEELLDAAARTDADISAGVRPEWKPTDGSSC